MDYFDPATWSRMKEMLPVGKSGELVVAKDLSSMGYKCDQTTEKHNYDLSATTKSGRLVRVEIKTDLLAHRTGNVGLEYEQNGKPSGIITTESDIWCWYLSGLNQILYFDTITVKSFIADKVWTGDRETVNSKYYLIPIKNIIDKAKLITNLK